MIKDTLLIVETHVIVACNPGDTYDEGLRRRKHLVIKETLLNTATLLKKDPLTE